jgi:hypothetical protein
MPEGRQGEESGHRSAGSQGQKENLSSDVIGSFPFEEELSEANPDTESGEASKEHPVESMVPSELIKPKKLLNNRKRGRSLVKAEESKRRIFKPEERLLVLDTWRRSGLPAKDFGALVGVGYHTLYKWYISGEELLTSMALKVCWTSLTVLREKPTCQILPDEPF